MTKQSQLIVRLLTSSSGAFNRISGWGLLSRHGDESVAMQVE